MRWKLVSLALAAACPAAQLGIGMEALAGDQTPAGAAEEVVYLDASALARLQLTNPNHYARAQRILTAANYLCRPRAPDLYLARFGAQDLSCTPKLLLTSNPPQWRIRFRLDHTRYLATVFVTDDPPRPLPAR
jgi:hypothetical protein